MDPSPGSAVASGHARGRSRDLMPAPTNISRATAVDIGTTFPVTITEDANDSANTVLAIDPGYEVSAYIRYDGARIIDHGIEANAGLLERLSREPDAYVTLEAIESYGMAVGREVFETVFWTGRLFEAATRRGADVSRLPRKAIKIHLCGTARATDSNLRVALCDRFGGSERAKGTKKAAGPLFQIKSHEWAALALSVTWWDLNTNGGAPPSASV